MNPCPAERMGHCGAVGCGGMFVCGTDCGTDCGTVARKQPASSAGVRTQPQASGLSLIDTDG